MPHAIRSLVSAPAGRVLRGRADPILDGQRLRSGGRQAALDAGAGKVPVDAYIKAGFLVGGVALATFILLADIYKGLSLVVLFAGLAAGLFLIVRGSLRHRHHSNHSCPPKP